MIEDHVGMSCVWIACCMIEKISKDCKIELCGLLAHSTVDVFMLWLVVKDLINPRRMRSEGYGTWSVCLSVCYHYSATTHNLASNKRY